MIGPREEREPSEDELREEDVTAADRLDDRVDEDEQDEDATVHTERDDLLPPADAPPNV